MTQSKFASHLFSQSSDLIIDDNVSETPARQVVEGRADLCIAPSESVISCWTSEPDRPRPVAVATLLQKHASALAVLKSSGIKSLAQLDGKRYASYGGRFEMNIVRELIRNAGGSGEVVETNPPKLECFHAVLNGDAEATWIFTPWEGVQAEMNEVELTTFPVGDDCDESFAYGYSPVLLAHPMVLEDEAKAVKLKAFLSTTARGYEFATDNPDQAADILVNISAHPSLDMAPIDFVRRSQRLMSSLSFYLSEGGGGRHWGVMNPERWEMFLSWLTKNNLLTARSGRIIARYSIFKLISFVFHL